MEVSNSIPISCQESNPAGEALLEEEVEIVQPAKVVLFNDEVHSFEEVIDQIIKATSCSREKAEALTWEVHTTGRAIVYSGEMPRCIEVSSILEEIQLSTHIEM
jgi:ATP-dependent Clp protease adaptor protein ClpS